VVAVDRLDVCGNFADPGSDGRSFAGSSRGTKGRESIFCSPKSIEMAYPVLPVHLGSLASSQAIMVGSLTYRPTNALM
jgi:hypothetical protein